MNFPAPSFKYVKSERPKWPEGLYVSAEYAIAAALRSRIGELARARISHVRDEGFGVERVGKAWPKIIEAVAPDAWSALSEAQKAAVLRVGYSTTMARVIDAAAKAEVERLRSTVSSDNVDKMSGPEFEHYCAKRLSEAGWRVSVTKASGDQGADLVATREGLTAVVQCKRYSGSVGNGAVQEAVTARLHYGADRACVVSNAHFTASAKEVARSTGAILLHYAELPQLASLLAIPPRLR